VKFGKGTKPRRVVNEMIERLAEKNELVDAADIVIKFGKPTFIDSEKKSSDKLSNQKKPLVMSEYLARA